MGKEIKTLFKHDLKIIHSHATCSIDRRSCFLSGNCDRIGFICLQVFGIRKLRNSHSTFTSVCIFSLHYEGSGYVGLCNGHLWKIAIPCTNSDLLFTVGDDDIWCSSSIWGIGRAWIIWTIHFHEKYSSYDNKYRNENHNNVWFGHESM